MSDKFEDSQEAENVENRKRMEILDKKIKLFEKYEGDDELLLGRFESLYRTARNSDAYIEARECLVRLEIVQMRIEARRKEFLENE